jgi:arylsulfatase A-like enzyme
MTVALFLRLSVLLFALLVFCLSPIAYSDSNREGNGRRVVIVVWDGMRPDFVSERHTPALWGLAREGVIFRNHHAAYLSATVVNGTAIATGCYPSQSGVFANYVFRPEIEPANFIDAGNPRVVRKGDELTNGKYLARPTTAEILQRAGKSTAIAGTKYVTVLHDRRATAGNAAARNSFVFFQGATLPNEAIELFTKALGPFPGLNDPRADEWTTKALVEVMWKDSVPEYSLLWLCEPDYTEHKSAPGSPPSIAAIESADKRLREILAALDKKRVRDKTDVFVVSDHGFSTIERSIDLLPQLVRAGFRATTQFAAQPAKGDIMVVGNGGTILFYVIGHDADVTRGLIEWLQQTDFAGVIFSREKVDGTFGLELAKIDTPIAPDVVMAFRWNDESNRFGVPGMIDADWSRQAGAGTHATLSRFDMHNLLIAAGPDFRRDVTNQLPTGNIDLAPTILHILGISSPVKFDGRILFEAMTNEAAGSPASVTDTKEASRDFSSGTWRQYLRVSRVGSSIYFDEGNGGFHRENALR